MRTLYIVATPLNIMTVCPKMDMLTFFVGLPSGINMNLGYL
jgi:hypothetical protein